MTTFVEILRARAQKAPDTCAFAFLSSDGAETRLTYSQLDRRARALGAQLQQAGAKGEPVLIVLQPGLDYVTAIFGCLYAGSIMVPCARPARADRAGRLRATAIDSGAKFAVGSPLLSDDPEFPPITWIAPCADEASADSWSAPAADADRVALLQYTSGSTASPRGVMVSHANLLANAGSIGEGFRHPRQAWAVTWLPPYHDMGLMGGLLQPIYCDAPSVVISPMDFVRQPILWLEAVSRYRARSSGGPNFAFDLCTRSIKPEQSNNLRLDCWELAYTGAEPVRAETLDRFANAFAHTGFRREFFFPCYGLAEATLYVAGGRLNTCTVSASALRLHRVIERPDPEASENDSDTQQLVSAGQPASALKVAIVDPEKELPCKAGCIGEIRVSGPGVAAGYWNRIEETQRTFHTRLTVDPDGTYLRTGDLGFMRDGELFITGRAKDLIIVRGQNHYPQDIENTVASASPAIRPGTCAAFSVESGNQEKLVLVLEMPRPRPEDPQVLGGDIRQAIAATHELQVSSIVLVRPGAIPRTSSGKLQRHECRAQYLSGTLQSLTVI